MAIADGTTASRLKPTRPRRRRRSGDLKKAQLRMGKFVEPSSRRVMLSELYADVIEDYRINHYPRSTISRIAGSNTCNHSSVTWPAADVTTDMCKRYIVWRQEAGMADSTINRTLAALKRMFHLATECTPPKVQFVPHIPMLKENNVRTGFVETEARMRLEQACSRIGRWMLAMFEVGCTYGWRHGSLLKMRVKQVDPHANVIRLEPGTTKNKKGLEVTMPRRVRELLLECIKGKSPEDCLFTRRTARRLRDFRRSWERHAPRRVCRDCTSMICAGPQPGTCAAGTSPRESQWRWGLEDNFCVSPLRNRGQSGHRPRHGYVGKSQDQQRQDLEQALAAKGGQVRDVRPILAANIELKGNEIHLRWKLTRHITFTSRSGFRRHFRAFTPSEPKKPARHTFISS